jgi:hypothetical protein
MSSANGHPCLTIRILPAGAALLLTVCAAGLSGCTYSYEFDPLTVGDDAAAQALEPRSNSQFVRAVYADILGRAPDVYDFTLLDGQGNELVAFPIQEQRDLVGPLDGMGDPAPLRAVLSAGLVGSEEVDIPEKAAVADPQAFVRDQFRTLLGREPNAYEAHAFGDAWATDDAAGPRAVIRAIVGSREYQSR